MKKTVIIFLIVGLGVLIVAASAAHAQRYDSSYGYEMRGLVPPSPFPGAHTAAPILVSEIR